MSAAPRPKRWCTACTWCNRRSDNPNRGHVCWRCKANCDHDETQVVRAIGSTGLPYARYECVWCLKVVELDYRVDEIDGFDNLPVLVDKRTGFDHRICACVPFDAVLPPVTNAVPPPVVSVPRRPPPHAPLPPPVPPPPVRVEALIAIDGAVTTAVALHQQTMAIRASLSASGAPKSVMTPLGHVRELVFSIDIALRALAKAAGEAVAVGAISAASSRSLVAAGRAAVEDAKADYRAARRAAEEAGGQDALVDFDAMYAKDFGDEGEP